VTVLTESIGDILDNFADAIEGGKDYRGGFAAAYKGVPSAQSMDYRESATNSLATAGSTTTATMGDIAASAGLRAVRSDAAPFFLLCVSQASGSGNTGAARKITSHNGVDTFVVAPAFPEAVANGDRLAIVEGFKRMRDVTDIEAEDGIAGGLDRTFSLRLVPGRRLPWYGNGYETFESTMELTIRLLKKGRERTARKSALENIQQMRTILTRLDVRGNYVQLVDVLSTLPETVEDTADKVVIKDKYRVVYRLSAAYL